MAYWSDDATLLKRYGRVVPRDKEGRLMTTPEEEALGYFDGIRPPAETPKPAPVTPAPAPSTPSAPAASPASAPAPPPPASMTALDKATEAPEAEAPVSLPTFTPQEPPGPGMMTGAMGALRSGMGMRQPPMTNMALAALKRLY